MTPSRIRARHCCRSNFMGTDRIEHIGKNVGRLTRVGAGQRLLHGVQNPHNILQSAGSKPPGSVGVIVASIDFGIKDAQTWINLPGSAIAVAIIAP